ncbi:MAG: 16S rRNA (uracil(1498)-N(3))-methyltransferase [Paracoccaceae bacterium]|nr:16S rRNA (uracil(1498)-N(3))-methyltransferase [Paracoccaceae bacterium]
MKTKIRLFVDHPLAEAQSVPLGWDQAHYLFSVMRKSEGDYVALFNGKNGEWIAKIDVAEKKQGVVRCLEMTKPQQYPPDIWLMFAPIKKARTDFIVEKATELGAARIMPLQTDFTNSERIKRDRLQNHAIEAAEQCGGTFVPEVTDMNQLEKLLSDWPEGRFLLFCDESKVGERVGIQDLPTGKWAILLGPEGGFSEKERKYMQAMQNSFSISLGPRILRTDTAAVAALTLWQNALGDWA